MSKFVKEKSIALMFSRTGIYMLVALIFACVISYIYCANMAVRTLTVLEKTRDSVQSLSVKVSEMEAKRLSVENKVSGETAKLLGFVEAKNPTFIMNKHGKVTLSLKID